MNQDPKQRDKEVEDRKKKIKDMEDNMGGSQNTSQQILTGDKMKVTQHLKR